MTNKVNNWIRGLIAAVVTGGATSGMSAIGIGIADAAGANIGGLNLKQVGVLFASGALVGLLAYLKQSPIPPAEDDPPAAGGSVPPFRPPVWIIGGLLALTLGATGCLVPKGSIAPGADPLVVQAEALTQTAGDSMDAFVQWEYRNRAAVGQDVTAAADLVREFGPAYLRELKAATRTYKALRNEPNADATRAAIKTLQDLLEQARNYYQPKGTT